ncbi:hypothetical protein Hypma_007316 [Hypsizygus marmoreus]|uniref:Uncharacterized protein n=1 Tax=Hypsizygus marmoreus TaxID=39966 RepID=A0A369KCQ6_HYPMA|nr:hypothetical protein Hypma_007316 [Hypsizygus marmoreus]
MLIQTSRINQMRHLVMFETKSNTTNISGAHGRNGVDLMCNVCPVHDELEPHSVRDLHQIQRRMLLCSTIVHHVNCLAIDGVCDFSWKDQPTPSFHYDKPAQHRRSPRITRIRAENVEFLYNVVGETPVANLGIKTTSPWRFGILERMDTIEPWIWNYGALINSTSEDNFAKAISSTPNN